jgi:hypothetical protein
MTNMKCNIRLNQTHICTQNRLVRLNLLNKIRNIYVMCEFSKASSCQSTFLGLLEFQRNSIFIRILLASWVHLSICPSSDSPITINNVDTAVEPLFNVSRITVFCHLTFGFNDPKSTISVLGYVFQLDRMLVQLRNPEGAA